MTLTAPDDDPLALFALWLAEATKKEPRDPNAMALSTVGADGMPSSRMVLLKDVSDEGFTFYTNTESRKGQELLIHPKAALLFYWKSLGRQVRIEGDISSVTSEEADRYFASRPRQSQIGAWASQQSRPLEGRFALEKQVARFTAKFGLDAVPRPPYWSGFCLEPKAIEFWQEGAFRLHDRLVFRREDPTKNNWTSLRLYP